MKALGYLRCSTLGQDLSPDAQRAAILAYASRSGLEVVGFYEDIGVSGATEVEDCPGLSAALGALRPGMALVVAKMDRLSRDVFKHALVERLVTRAKAKIVSADGTGNGDGPEAALMRAVVSAMAAYERALISLRTKAAMAVRRSRGQPTSGTAPTGYRIAGDRLLEVPGEMAAVRLAQSLHASGLGYEAIARELWSRGYRSRAGTRIPRSTVARWLARPSMPAEAVAV